MYLYKAIDFGPTGIVASKGDAMDSDSGAISLVPEPETDNGAREGPGSPENSKFDVPHNLPDIVCPITDKPIRPWFRLSRSSHWKNPFWIGSIPGVAGMDGTIVKIFRKLSFYD